MCQVFIEKVAFSNAEPRDCKTFANPWDCKAYAICKQYIYVKSMISNLHWKMQLLCEIETLRLSIQETQETM